MYYIILKPYLLLQKHMHCTSLNKQIHMLFNAMWCIQVLTVISLLASVRCSACFGETVLAFCSGGGEVPCWGAFIGPPASRRVCLGRSADGDHWDPAVGASRVPGMLRRDWRPPGGLREHAGSFRFEETHPAEPGNNPDHSWMVWLGQWWPDVLQHGPESQSGKYFLLFLQLKMQNYFIYFSFFLFNLLSTEND